MFESLEIMAQAVKNKGLEVVEESKNRKRQEEEGEQGTLVKEEPDPTLVEVAGFEEMAKEAQARLMAAEAEWLSAMKDLLILSQERHDKGVL